MNTLALILLALGWVFVAPFCALWQIERFRRRQEKMWSTYYQERLTASEATLLRALQRLQNEEKES